jgi:uncharacterized protein YjbI with pentapeptide repeats
MANEEHLKRLKQGVEQWNKWRLEDYNVAPDLRGADLSGANLRGAELSGANLSGANLSSAALSYAELFRASLDGADLSGANLFYSRLRFADLSKAKLRDARLDCCDLHGANLTCADLTNADLSGTVLVETDLTNATITGCRIYGVSAWNVTVADTLQNNLVITKEGEPTVTVDDLEIAQFIYLLLNNQNVRKIIDTVTSKVVLILGRFSEQRKAVLDAIRERLRPNFTPVIFDFEKPSSKDVTGTVETLARLARFIIADLTDPSSIPHELATVVPFLRTTPVLPLRLAGSGGYSMFDDFRAYPWVLKVYEYTDAGSLIAALGDVIAPAEEMATNLHEHTVG